MPTGKPPPGAGLQRALDEVRFGRSRTLDLRASLPTPADAAARAEAWLRERQVAKSEEVLIITGRGNKSEGGVSVVREAVHRQLLSLRRRGVVSSLSEHTPGSFAVTLAPITALFEVPSRRRERTRPPRPATPVELKGFEPETLALLRKLAVRSLQALGAPEEDSLVESEMLHQFGALAAAVPSGIEREKRMREALQCALDEFDEGE